jgi:sigma-B regulation protein RsbU (phosphoserine phosphatase)
MEGIEYRTACLTLAPGETLFLYTDGVTEAMDADKNIYSDPRLMDLIKTLKGASAESIIQSVNRSIKDFTGGAPQSDDITILALQYKCASCIQKEENDGA